jgi:hypothetical protein
VWDMLALGWWRGLVEGAGATADSHGHEFPRHHAHLPHAVRVALENQIKAYRIALDEKNLANHRIPKWFSHDLEKLFNDAPEMNLNDQER